MALALLALISGIAACSAAEQHPSEPGDCPDDAGCFPALPEQASGNGSSAAGGSAAGAGGGTCAELAFQSTCAACMDQFCCSQDQRCAENDACLTLATCASVCAHGDTECVASCADQNSAGTTLYKAVTQCLQTSCPTECNAAVGVGCGNLTFQRATCPACVTQSCCSQALACGNNPDCLTIQQCAVVCLPTDTDCLNSCSTLGPDGLATFTTLEQCINASCSALCP